jgi:hypothetical protein
MMHFQIVAESSNQRVVWKIKKHAGIALQEQPQLGEFVFEHGHARAGPARTG